MHPNNRGQHGKQVKPSSSSDKDTAAGMSAASWQKLSRWRKPKCEPPRLPDFSPSGMLAQEHQRLIVSVNAARTSLKIKLFLCEPGLHPRTLASFNTQDLLTRYSRWECKSRDEVKVFELSGQDMESHRAIFNTMLVQIREEAKITDQHSDQNIGYICHRIIRGGDRTGPVILSQETEHIYDELGKLSAENRPALEIVKACVNALPRAKNILFFDTSFHLSIPALRRANVDRPSAVVHGINYGSVLRQVAVVHTNDEDELNILAFHLGDTCSGCAIRKGVCIDVSTEMTPRYDWPRTESCDDTNAADGVGQLSLSLSRAATQAKCFSQGWPSICSVPNFSIISECHRARFYHPTVWGPDQYTFPNEPGLMETEYALPQDPEHDTVEDSWREGNRLDPNSSFYHEFTPRENVNVAPQVGPSPPPNAEIAFEKFVEEIVVYASRGCVLLDGCVDALVFTGGIGTGSDVLRRAVCDRLASLRFSISYIGNLTHVSLFREGPLIAMAGHGSLRQILVMLDDEEEEMAWQWVVRTKMGLKEAEFRKLARERTPPLSQWEKLKLLSEGKSITLCIETPEEVVLEKTKDMLEHYKKDKEFAREAEKGSYLELPDGGVVLGDMHYIDKQLDIEEAAEEAAELAENEWAEMTLWVEAKKKRHARIDAVEAQKVAAGEMAVEATAAAKRAARATRKVEAYAEKLIKAMPRAAKEATRASGARADEGGATNEGAAGRGAVTAGTKRKAADTELDEETITDKDDASSSSSSSDDSSELSEELMDVDSY